MISLVRSGPKTLVLESSSVQQLVQYLTDSTGTYRKSHIFECYDNEDKSSLFRKVFDKAEEGYTIVFIIEKTNDEAGMRNIRNVMVVAEEADVILCRIMNEGKAHLISNARMAPRIIILRAMGNLEKVIEEISSDHECSVYSMLDILDENNGKGTVILITDKPIQKSMSMKDIYEKVIFVEERYYPLLKSLRSHALKYLNKGIANKDWYEIEIRIYDKYNAYKLHYEKLLSIIEALELGIILGESWGKDYPRPMMSVEVYRIRFFTFYNPGYIKKIILGLEYTGGGTRIVDYDVYYNRRKIDWVDVVEDGIKARHLLGMRFREDILSKLSEEEKTELLDFEEQILETRK
jgi:hypothetical protein